MEKTEAEMLEEVRRKNPSVLEYIEHVLPFQPLFGNQRAEMYRLMCIRVCMLGENVGYWLQKIVQEAKKVPIGPSYVGANPPSLPPPPLPIPVDWETIAPVGVDEATDVKEDQCAICLNNKHKVHPDCGHLSMCFGCARGHVNLHKDKSRCPICNAPITTKMHVVF